LKGVTISDNNAAYAAGIMNYQSDLTLENSTVADNAATAKVGGILSNQGTVTMANATITNNSAGTTYAAVYGYNSDLYMVNTIVINNASDDDIVSRNEFAGDIYIYSSWYDAAKTTTTHPIVTNSATPNQTSAYISGNLDPLGSYEGLTETVRVAGGVAVANGTFVYGNSIDGYYCHSSGSFYFNLDNSLHSDGNINDRINSDQRGKIRDDSFIPTMGAYEVNTSMVNELPDGDEYSTDEFLDLIKVHSATQDDFDGALLEFIA
jgi:hypothetical protein